MKSKPAFQKGGKIFIGSTKRSTFDYNTIIETNITNIESIFHESTDIAISKLLKWLIQYIFKRQVTSITWTNSFWTATEYEIVISSNPMKMLRKYNKNINKLKIRSEIQNNTTIFGFKLNVNHKDLRIRNPNVDYYIDDSPWGTFPCETDILEIIKESVDKPFVLTQKMHTDTIETEMGNYNIENGDYTITGQFVYETA